MSGVVGIKSDEDVSQKLYYSLSTIQHRGQDSAGVIFSDGNSLNRIKGMGLVNDVLSDYQTVDNNSKIGIGHVRSSS